jgi:myosin heavy subunit
MKLDAARENMKSDGELTDAEKAEAKAAREELREARKELRAADRKTLIARAKTLSPEERKELKTKLAARSAARKATRAERAEKKRAALKEAVAKGTNKAALRNELSRHAWRVARLERIVMLAETAERSELLAKAKELLAKEAKVHEKRMQRIAAGKTEASAPKAAVESPTPNQPATPAAAPAAPAKVEAQ